MASKVPHAAFCEEWDEDKHDVIPETRRVANITARRSRPDLKAAVTGLIGRGTDSAFSSRTAAAPNPAQSAPSGRTSPVLHKLDTTLKASARSKDLVLNQPQPPTRKTSSAARKDRVKDRSARPARQDKMQVGTYPASGHPPPPPPLQSPASASRSRRRERETAYVRHYPGTCWECEQGLYHASTPIEPLAVDYPYYASPQQPTPVHEFPPPPSPSTPRYPQAVIEDINVSRGSRPRRSSRSSSYYADQRPVSFHGMMPGMGSMVYGVPPMNHYEHGPPPSSSAYTNPPSPYVMPAQYAYPQSRHYRPDYVEQPREHSASRTRQRRSSAYGPPMLEHDPSQAIEDDEEPLQRRASREPRAARARRPSRSSHYEVDEDYYRMPPPSRPTSRKENAAPRIIQKRPDLPHKSPTSTSIPRERSSSKTFDLSEMDAALPDHRVRRLAREAVLPERSRSMNESRRSTAYYESPRASRMTVETPRRRRRPQVYYNYSGSSDIDEKQREAEEYQAVRSGRPMPLTTDALVNAKATHAIESDSGSQKSRSSRGSDARTQSGSAAGSKADDENNIVMTMNGVTMSFTQEAVGGKTISVRTGDAGAVELNFEGKRPKKYLPSRSDYSGGSEARRSRDDRRSDRASRRSSRSTYGSRGIYE